MVGNNYPQGASRPGVFVVYNEPMEKIQARYFDLYHYEKREHKKTKEMSEKRMEQIRFLLVENNQLHKELDQLRETGDNCLNLGSD